ncbi:hypothetical protein CEXT_401271 [Caerostris extrusa]|uniref:Uncharacterized protein n=1 Tax=Caerostris extrusa TaxID=172846 RepID=A0AAV4PD29_CAEEX|nr:hypothetical protein CEXT_401271 [Caerostris extrusa]
MLLIQIRIVPESGRTQDNHFTLSSPVVVPDVPHISTIFPGVPHTPAIVPDVPHSSIVCPDVPYSPAVINALSTDRRTPLHFTCRKGWAACTELLLQMGADIHAAQSPHTPLHEACFMIKKMCRDINKIWSKYKCFG